MKPRDEQGRRYAERSVSRWQAGMRADRSEGMKGISGSLIDRMRRRSGVDAAGAVGHWC